MRIDRSVALIPAAAAIVAMLGACDPGTGSDAATPAATKTVTAAPSPSASSLDDIIDDIQASNSAARQDLQDQIDQASRDAKAAVEVPDVPNVVGENHADALTILHTAGFMVNEEDASPEGRMILMNSNWKVCRQDPAPGTSGKSVLRVAIYSVKLDESC